MSQLTYLFKGLRISNGVYEQTRRTRAAVRGFINYLKKPARHPAGRYEERKPTNREP